MNSWRERREEEEKQKDAEIRFRREENKHAWRRRRGQLTHSHLLNHPLVALTLFIVKKCCNFTTVWVIFSLTAVFLLSISICLVHSTFIFDSHGNLIWELTLAFIWSTLTPLSINGSVNSAAAGQVDEVTNTSKVFARGNLLIWPG